jgi:hypothetical protein
VEAGTEDANHGGEVSAVAKDDSLQGCEKGQAVAEVASSKGNKQGPGHDPCAKGSEPPGQGAEGKQTAEDAKAAAKAKQDAKAAAKADSTVSDHGGGPPEDAGPPGSSGASAASHGNGNGSGKP